MTGFGFGAAAAGAADDVALNENLGLSYLVAVS